MSLDIEYVKKPQYKRLKRYSEVIIQSKNAFSVFGGHVTQKDDGNLSSSRVYRSQNKKLTRTVHPNGPRKQCYKC